LPIPLTGEDLLHLRLARWKGSRRDFPESELGDHVEKLLPYLIEQAGLGVVLSVSREYPLVVGRVDFVCAMIDGFYALVEVKRERLPVQGDFRISYAIGQLLTYGVAFQMAHGIEADRVHLVLVSDVELPWAKAAIGAYGLPITVFFVGQEYAEVLRAKA